MGNESLDDAILAALPAGSIVLSVIEHGNTNWSTGHRVDVQIENDEKSYFLKIIEREELVGMAEAEYEGQKAIFDLLPENSVKPVAWGYFQSSKSKSWYLAEYRNLRARTPPLQNFLPLVKRMHQASISPTGKFGFHVTPFYGPPPMVVDWTGNWEEFWIREFRSGLTYVQSMRGNDPELVDLAEEFIQKVAVRLLRPLQTGGRDIKPSLCHGDLWDGNIQIDIDTQEPIIFDPCAFYGHHEVEFQCMQSPRYKVGLEFVELYKKEIGASYPIEDFDDRISLYAIRNDLMVAGMWPHWASLVDKAKEEMRRLLEKHPNGIDGFEGSLEPTRATNAASSLSENNANACAKNAATIHSVERENVQIQELQYVSPEREHAKAVDMNAITVHEIVHGGRRTLSPSNHKEATGPGYLEENNTISKDSSPGSSPSSDGFSASQSEESDNSLTTTSDSAAPSNENGKEPEPVVWNILKVASRLLFG